MVVGLTQPQLGGYDSYVNGQLVGSGNAQVLVHTFLVMTTLIYFVNDMITTTEDAVGNFVVWAKYLLVPISVSVCYLM